MTLTLNKVNTFKATKSLLLRKKKVKRSNIGGYFNELFKKDN